MKKNAFIVGLATAIIFLNACSDKGMLITSRKYRPGWYISTKNNTQLCSGINENKSMNKPLKIDGITTQMPVLATDFSITSDSNARHSTLLASVERKSFSSVKSEKIALSVKKNKPLSLSNLPRMKRDIESTAFITANDLPVDGLGLAGFITGIVGLIILPVPLGILAIIFSAIGMGRISKKKSKGMGFAITGLVLGIIDVVVGLLIIAAVMSI